MSETLADKINEAKNGDIVIHVCGENIMKKICPLFMAWAKEAYYKETALKEAECIEDECAWWVSKVYETYEKVDGSEKTIGEHLTSFKYRKVDKEDSKMCALKLLAEK